MMGKKITTVAYQNVVDVCLQEYGSLEFLFALHVDNGLAAFPAKVQADQQLYVFPERVTGSKRTIAILQERTPGTGEYVQHSDSDALFWDGYLHPENYLYPDAHLLKP